MNEFFTCETIFFFDISTQEGEGGFELVTSASWGVVPNWLSYPLKTLVKQLWKIIQIHLLPVIFKFVVRFVESNMGRTIVNLKLNYIKMANLSQQLVGSHSNENWIPTRNYRPPFSLVQKCRRTSAETIQNLDNY
jgi:hypothetical protein